MRRIRAILILFVLPLFALAAQTTTEWYMNKPIANITFTGLHNVTIGQLQGIINPYIGQPFTTQLSTDLQAKLFATDYFESFTLNAVAPNGSKSKVIINVTVVERPVIASIEINGNASIRRSDILDAIVLKVGDQVNQVKVRVDAEAIKNLYLNRGYPEVQVQGSIQKVNQYTANVIFDVKEGSQTKVKSIEFSGNSFASASTLKRLLKTKEQSLFNPGVYQASKIAEDKQAIETYYHDHGYIDAKVTKVTKDVTTDSSGKSSLTLTYYIDEGEQYTYGGMSFEGNTLYTNAQLQAQVRQVPGKILNKSQLDADYARIVNLYTSDGYIYNVMTLQPVRDEKNRSISYVVHITERERAHIESILLKGLKKTKPYVVLRELPFEVGDIFSAKQYSEAMQNLQNLQFFSSVTPDVVPGSAEGLVDVVYTLEEGKTTDINFGVQFGGGAGQGFPFGGFLKWTDKNFQGTGQSLSVGTDLSQQKQDLTFSFNNNWLFGTRWQGGIDFSIAHTLTTGVEQDILLPVFSDTDPNRVPDPYDGHYVWAADGTGHSAGDPYNGSTADLQSYINSGAVLTDYAYAVKNSISIPSTYLMQYNSFDTSLGVSAGYLWQLPVGRLSVGSRLSTTLSYVNYDPNVYRPFDVSIRDNLDTLQPVTSVLLNLSFDTRDIIYNPTKGIYLKQSATYTGGILPSVKDYIKTDTKAQAFATLFDVPLTEGYNLKGVLGLNSDLSFIFPQPHYSSTLGKWETSVVATSQDLLYIDGLQVAKGWPQILDGKVLWDNWIQLRMPIVEKYVWWDWFFEGAGIWSEISDFAQMKLSDFLFSFGGGARITIPGLPIGIYLTKRFKFGSDGTIQWQAGSVFHSDKRPTSGLDFVISFTAEIY